MIFCLDQKLLYTCTLQFRKFNTKTVLFFKSLSFISTIDLCHSSLSLHNRMVPRPSGCLLSRQHTMEHAGIVCQANMDFPTEFRMDQDIYFIIQIISSICLYGLLIYFIFVCMCTWIKHKLLIFILFQYFDSSLGYWGKRRAMKTLLCAQRHISEYERCKSQASKKIKLQSLILFLTVHYKPPKSHFSLFYIWT